MTSVWRQGRLANGKGVDRSIGGVLPPEKKRQDSTWWYMCMDFIDQATLSFSRELGWLALLPLCARTQLLSAKLPRARNTRMTHGQIG